MKGIAAANKVNYNMYIYRIYNGQTPEEAASAQSPAPKKKRDIPVPNVREEYKHNEQDPKDRFEALQQIDDIIRTECDPCGTRIAMNKRNGNNSSRLEKICNSQCPVGKRIQELSKHLTVGPRKSVLEVYQND
ncbi:zinc-finger domain-containing protein [Paenibacillus sp. 7516]|uniref:zinc-finger domain-containing protein n=1 Tax=Paenibacillus sp. 7516 TaxID=2022549 RepID=UPI0014821949|nr:zinc-finger domain-containing protein [Paenibacillus sp. 7516]